ncbi:OmpA family protein [Arthrobacter alpinus]|nr:OmpA family protein [Arthrobacter alpinus]
MDLTVPALATATPAEVTAKLKAFKAIPNLAGRTVKWYGVGDQHGTQPALIPSQRQNYQDIYASILSDAGANASFHPGPVVTTKAEPRSGKHGIRPVPTAPQVVVDFPKTGTTVFGNGSSLGFLPDSTGFRTPGAAAETGAQIAQWLVENPAGAITVTGTTASAGTTEARQELSLARAKAVCALAVSAGADPSRLHAAGAGNDFSGSVPDLLPDGTLDPVAAEANRTVILSFAS